MSTEFKDELEQLPLLLMELRYELPVNFELKFLKYNGQ